MSAPILEIYRCGIVSYQHALALQERRRDSILAGTAPAAIFLLQHPPTITAGSTTDPADLLLSPEEFAARGISLSRTNRGGRSTYHGPGQLVGYPVLDLRTAPGAHAGGQPSVRAYLRALEEMLIRALATWGLKCGRSEGAAGVWIETRKIASVGVAVRQWVTTHGFALNVEMDLGPFHTILPCGFSPDVMTTLAREVGSAPAWHAVEAQVTASFASVLGFEPLVGDPYTAK